jgi:hypothetical protein
LNTQFPFHTAIWILFTRIIVGIHIIVGLSAPLVVYANAHQFVI